MYEKYHTINVSDCETPKHILKIPQQSKLRLIKMRSTDSLRETRNMHVRGTHLWGNHSCNVGNLNDETKPWATVPMAGLTPNAAFRPSMPLSARRAQPLSHLHHLLHQMPPTCGKGLDLDRQHHRSRRYKLSSPLPIHPSHKFLGRPLLFSSSP